MHGFFGLTPTGWARVLNVRPAQVSNELSVDSNCKSKRKVSHEKASVVSLGNRGFDPGIRP
jgi:hypothetical protein